MRIIIIMTIAFAVCSLNAAGGSLRYAVPTKEQVPVYRNDTRKVFEQPLFFIGKDDHCAVKATEKSMARITTPAGKTGWVEIALVRFESVNSKYSYEAAEVLEHLDNPTPIVIPGANITFDQNLSLDRTFADELRQNVDRETIARQTGE
jgi:hypothetical protein